MMHSSLQEVAEMLDVPWAGDRVPFSGVSIDSRTLNAGELFVALNGPNFSGHTFTANAMQAGAAAALVDQLADCALPQLQVKDTLTALQQLAQVWRGKFSPTVIGITGSNGKTTMRSLVAACLDGEVLATAGNLNNEIGVPLMLLRLEPCHQMAVFEMGANHAGEIARLTALVDPGIGIVTNAGPAHLEGFGSVDGVAHAKGELFAALGADDVAIVNADDPYCSLWREMAAPARVMTFGSTPTADVYFSEVVAKADGLAFSLHLGGETAPVAMKLHGLHNAMNACGAAAVAHCTGVALKDIAARLAAVDPEPGRQRRLSGVNGAVVIDDSYNANPASMLAAARALAAASEHPWMAIGDMGELGDDAVRLHGEIGTALRAAGIERLFTHGALSAHASSAFGAGAKHFDELSELTDTVARQLHRDVSILVKGSRSSQMERVVNALATSEDV